MPYTEKQNLIWNPTPLCGHRSLYATLKPLLGVSGAMPHSAMKGGVFKRKYSDQWKSMTSFVVVRPTVERFVSAIARLGGVSSDAPANLQELANCYLDGGVSAVIEKLRSTPTGKRHPWFWAQSSFLCAGVDHVVPLHFLSRFIAEKAKINLRHDNVTPQRDKTRLTDEEKQDVLSLFSRDEKVFENTPVWHPGDGRMVFKLYGECRPCNAHLRP